MTLVSIIIPCFNVAEHIDKTLQSITAQTYENLEIILVDDGNEISIAEILPEEFKGDDRITIVRHDENRGLSNSRNTGLKQSKGDYIFFWDADDNLAVNAVETLVSLAEKNNAEIVRGVLARTDGQNRWVTKRGRKLLKDNTETNFEKSPELTMDFTSCGVLFSKSFLNHHNLTFEPNLYMQDILFTSRSLIHAKKVCMTDLIVGDYFQSPQSASRLRTENRFNSLFKLYEKLEQEFKKSELAKEQRNTILAGFINAGVNTFLLWKLEDYKAEIDDLNRLSNLLEQVGVAAINQYCIEMHDEPSYLRLHATRLKKYSLAALASSMNTVSDDALVELFGDALSETVPLANKFLNDLRQARAQSSTNNRLVLDKNENVSSPVRSLVGKLLSRFKSG